MLEKTLEGSLDCKETKPVNPKGNQSWILIGRTDAEAPILWPPDVTRKDPDARKDWRWRSRGWQRMRWWDDITDCMDLSLSKLQGWWWPWKPGKELDMTEQLNWILFFKSPFATGPFFWASVGPKCYALMSFGDVLIPKKYHKTFTFSQSLITCFSAHEMMHIFISSSFSFQAEYKIKSFPLGGFIFTFFVSAVLQGTCKMGLELPKQSFAGWSVYWAKPSVSNFEFFSSIKWSHGTHHQAVNMN